MRGPAAVGRESMSIEEQVEFALRRMKKTVWERDNSIADGWLKTAMASLDWVRTNYGGTSLEPVDFMVTERAPASP